LDGEGLGKNGAVRSQEKAEDQGQAFENGALHRLKFLIVNR
jgi:hypothetical protein